MGALSAQLKELDKTQMARELDALAEQEGNLVKLLALVKATDDKIKVSGRSCLRSRMAGPSRPCDLLYRRCTLSSIFTHPIFASIC